MSWRSLIVGSLALVPILIYVALGGYSLWETGQLRRIWWVAPAFWIVAWGLVQIWKPRRPSARTGHAVDIPPHWTPRDRQAAEIVREFQEKVDRLPAERLVDLSHYQAEVQSLSIALARHYHPGTSDPFSSLTVPEVVAAVRLAVDDLEQWLLTSVPGSRLLTIKQWRMLQSAPKWYRRIQNVTWAASILFNPANLARYWSSKATLDPVTTELQTELLAVIYLRFMRQVGFYLIEMNSGRLRGGADAYRRAFPAMSGGAAPQPVTIALVGQVSSGKSSLVNALTGSEQAAVDVLPKTSAVRRYQVTVGEPPVPVSLLDTPGYSEVGATEDQMDQIRAALDESHAVLLVMDAHSPAREADRRTIGGIEARLKSEPRFKPPPILGVLTHVDLLSPSLEWSPPYDWRDPKRPKEQSLHDAVAYTRGLFGRSLVSVVPVCADVARKRAWGVLEELLPALTDILTETQSAALLCAFERELDRDQLKTLLKQVRRFGSELLRSWIEERLQSARATDRRS